MLQKIHNLLLLIRSEFPYLSLRGTLRIHSVQAPSRSNLLIFFEIASLTPAMTMMEGYAVNYDCIVYRVMTND